MIVPKKSLGQNFLSDDNVARKIVESLGLNKDDVVVEIGPGKGELTRRLVGLTSNVVGIELDKRAVELLRESFDKLVTVVHDDVLNVRLSSLVRQGQKLRVVGNIPYYITSQILFWLFEQRDLVADATLMMQLEVARRLNARPKTKEYGILSVAAQFNSTPEILFRVSRNSFFPKPNVDSAVVRLSFNRVLPNADVTLFTNIVRSTFGKRRKTLRNGLKSMGLEDHQLERINFDLNKRPEELSTDEFLELTSEVEPMASSVTMKF